MRILAQPAFDGRYFNPYTRLLYTNMEALGVTVDEFSFQRLLTQNYTVWHRHWPERNLNDPNFSRALTKTLVFLNLMNVARLRGMKNVWTVHNLGTHEQFYPQLEAWFWRAFIDRLDGYISLSKTAMEAAQERFPRLRDLPGFVIPHSHYRGEYPDFITPQEARASLDIPPSAKVLLLIGNIRGYKNAPELIRVFRQYSDPEAILYIAGRPSFPEIKQEIETEANLDGRVKLYLDYIPPEKMQVYLYTADLVVLPYTEILNSGSALLALSFNRPILVPRKGSLAELQSQVGQEWIHTYEDELTPSKLEEALNWAMTTQRPEPAPLDAFDWKELTKQTIDAYKVIGSR